MNKDAIEEIRGLYFKLKLKKPKLKEDLYTMNEIKEITKRMLVILKKEDANHPALSPFNAVIARVKYFNGYGASSEFFENIEEVKELAMQAFQQLFDKEPGISA